MAYYAVAKGKNIGVFDNWNECKNNTHGFSGAVYKKFNNKKDALEFINKYQEKPKKKKKAYYAVAVGEEVGIFYSWDECKEQTSGYPGAIYKKFDDKNEALRFIEENKSNSTIKKKRNKKKKKENLDKTINFITKDDLNKINNSKYKNSLEVKDIKQHEAVAYVDGSYNQDTFECGYGVVYFDSKGKKQIFGLESRKELIPMRNVTGEIKSAIIAIMLAIQEGKKRIYLHYDYEGIEKWATKVWKAKKIGTASYLKYIESIEDDIDIIFIKVPAHAGIKYNEEADMLAKKAIF